MTRATTPSYWHGHMGPLPWAHRAKKQMGRSQADIENGDSPPWLPEPKGALSLLRVTFRSAHFDCTLDDSFGPSNEVVRGGDQVVNLDGANTN